MTTPAPDPDPRFPDRPTHPDFAELSEAVRANDMLADEHGQDGLLDRIREFVDVDSLEYIALHRSLIGAAELSRLGEPVNLPAALQASIIDGFVLGAAFERARGADK